MPRVPSPAQPSVAVPPTRVAGRWISALSALLLGLLLSVMGAPAAAAHDTIEGSNPADGATVATVPASVTLTFDEQPQDFSPVIQVTGPDGTDWADGTPTVSGTDVSVPVKAGAPAGAYQVAYRIVSSDGHPVTGELSFTAEAAAAGPSTTAASSPAPASSSGTTTAASSPASSSPASSSPVATSSAASPATSGAVTPAASTSDSGSGVSGWLIAVIILVIAAGGAVVAVLVRRARGGSSA